MSWYVYPIISVCGDLKKRAGLRLLQTPIWQRTADGIGQWSRQDDTDVDGRGSRCECLRWILWQRTAGDIGRRSRQDNADVDRRGSRCECLR
jgi:hypothetical protein